MTATIERRLAKAEATIEASEARHNVVVQFGHTQRLPASYVGERHIVTVSRLPNGHYEWEERPGPGPAEAESSSGASLAFRINFVGSPAAEPELQEPAASVAESKAEVPPANALARIHAAVTGPPQLLPPAQPERRFRPSPPIPVTPWNWA
jgi:hypothetical protein